jgi:hypothetical protein
MYLNGVNLVSVIQTNRASSSWLDNNLESILTNTIESDEFELTITLLEEQRDRVELLMRRILNKRVALLSFDVEHYDYDNIKRFIRDEHREVSFSGQRKNITRDAMLVQGDLSGFELQIDGITLVVIPWNNTTSRFERARSFELRLGTASVMVWKFHRSNMVPCILFEDIVNQKWHVLRVDSMPWDGLL